MFTFEDIKRKVLTDCEEYADSEVSLTDLVAHAEEAFGVKIDLGETAIEGYSGEDTRNHEILNSLLTYHTDVLWSDCNKSLDELMSPEKPIITTIADRLRNFYLSQTRFFIMTAFIAEYENGAKGAEATDALNKLAQEFYAKYAALHIED